MKPKTTHRGSLWSMRLLILIGGGILASGMVRAEDAASPGEQLFALRVEPLLREKCLACHGKDPEEIKGGFDLRDRAAALQGGDTFGDEVLVPGEPDKSHLLAMVRRTDEDYKMPPKEADKLSAEQTGWIREWVQAGAPWPEPQRVAAIYRRYAEGISVRTRGGLSEEWTHRKYKPANLWAYQPIERPEVPDGSHPVDYFVDQRLDALELPPAAPADRRTLVRRAYYDLLGLPPQPQQIRDFIDDEATTDVAFAALVKQLLASPHYGEQWGRHWLDVVRYADSAGFANDYERPNAWRYRDYVIRAFNNDKPYDQFVREQLAGDELDASDPELLIATGFLRMGPWEHTGMSVARITRQQFLDDVTDSVGQVFLAHALQCASCHDHKFDPVPTSDYYGIQAVFASTQFADRDADWLEAENREGMAEDRALHERRLRANQELLAKLSAQQLDNDRRWFAQQGLPYKSREEARKAGASDEQIPPRHALKTPDEFGQERIGRKWQTRFVWESDRYRPVAFSVFSGWQNGAVRSGSRLKMPPQPLKGKVEKTAILKGGDVFSPTTEVAPGVLSAVPGWETVTVPTAARGRREALANWIASPENTLTARVIANRVWHYHFGRGLAGNPNNFGATGKKPTHPQLLDWLASELIREGWSIKHLHRVIMSSAAYQRSSHHSQPKQMQEKDPKFESYAAFVPRRLAAEELRDAMLLVSGELNREQGGIPVRPDMNLEAALQPRMIMGTFAPSYVPNPLPAQRNRRSIYVHKTRGHRDPFFETFNQPGSEKSCELRDRSTVATQALTLLNGQETNDRALALAARVLREVDGEQEAVQRAFELVYGRLPLAQEQALAVRHWRESSKRHEAVEPAAMKLPSQVTRRANEENTGVPFTFVERLFAHEAYVPDLQPHQVDARTRALADLCLVLLNSNEFVYVY